MTRVADCLFCRIVAGELPSKAVDATTLSYAFRDVHPCAPTHVLVVPKDHIDDAAALSSGDGPILSDMLATANKIAVDEGLADRGYRLVFNVGKDSGNSVGHLHLHLLGGRVMAWPPG